jgi:hypothetical protein
MMVGKIFSQCDVQTGELQIVVETIRFGDAANGCDLPA